MKNSILKTVLTCCICVLFICAVNAHGHHRGGGSKDLYRAAAIVDIVANMSQKTGIETELVFIKTGFCVILKSIDVEFGYNNFLVEIDKIYKENTCPFDAVMAHEKKHINTYLSVIDDFKSDLQNTFFTAADSVMPVFISKKSDFDNAIEVINQQIKNHPDLILTIQKIKAEEEIRNKKIDQLETGEDLLKCFE